MWVQAGGESMTIGSTLKNREGMTPQGRASSIDFIPPVSKQAQGVGEKISSPTLTLL